jgi:dephospho-CoA kinase
MEAAMLKVGLTGGMGSGKATVAGIFARHGAYVVDADAIAHELIRPGRDAYKEIVKEFGEDILLPGGDIHRRTLAKAVFGDHKKLKRLNAIIHPRVIGEIRRLFEYAARNKECKVAVANVPLLFEAGMEREFNRLVVVTCSREEQVRRTCTRDGLTPVEVENRLDVQMPLVEKEKRADYVIYNDGSLKETEKQAARVWEKLLQDATF